MAGSAVLWCSDFSDPPQPDTETVASFTAGPAGVPPGSWGWGVGGGELSLIRWPLPAMGGAPTLDSWPLAGETITTLVAAVNADPAWQAGAIVNDTESDAATLLDPVSASTPVVPPASVQLTLTRPIP